MWLTSDKKIMRKNQKLIFTHYFFMNQLDGQLSRHFMEMKQI